MGIKLYEVAAPLESTQTLHVNVAAANPDQACDIVHDMLTVVSEPRSVGDAIKFNWRRNDMAASEITAFEIAPNGA